MIFTKFFKPKWQNKNKDIRIECLAELDATSLQDQEIIKSLLENDDNFLVRKAALLKLNSTDELFNCFTNHQDAATKEFAGRQLAKQCEPNQWLSLNDAHKRRFIEAGLVKQHVETLLSIETDDRIIDKLLGNHVKPFLHTVVVLKSPSKTAKLNSLSHIDDVNALEKLMKKASDTDVKQIIAEKLQALYELSEKPKLVRKQAQLLLSKFLALKDGHDYQKMVAKRNAIVSEWESLEIACLDDASVLLAKYAKIETQIENQFASEFEKFKQAEIAEKVEKEKQTQRNDFEQTLKELSQTITDAVFNNEALNEDHILEKIGRLSTDVEQSLLLEKDKTNLNKRAISLKHKLRKIPLVAEYVSEATQLISKLSGISIPSSLDELNERAGAFEDLCAKYETLARKAEDVLPASITSAYAEIKSHWSVGTTPLSQAQAKLYRQTQRKLGEVRKLIESGKFYATFGLFKKITAQFEQLSQNQQQRLQHEYDAINVQVNELSDWDSYIATPKKQELLAKARGLLHLELSDIPALAAEIRRLRKQWNTLGHAEQDIDDALNNEFNALLETAFAPCRAYYAELESLRDAHLEKRASIINEVSELAKTLTDSQHIDYQELDAELNKLMTAWKQAGEVDRNKYKQLSAEFSDAIKPIKELVKQNHLENAGEKQQLVNIAQSLADSNDINESVKQLKNLQQQWKDVGFAGVKLENQLWKQFRQANDIVFKKRDEQRTAFNNEQAQLETRAKNEFDALLNEKLDSRDEILSVLDRLNALENEVSAYKSLSELQGQIKSHRAQCEMMLRKMKKDVEAKNLANVVTLYSSLSKKEINVEDLENNTDFQNLSNNWQKQLLQCIQKPEDSIKRDEVCLQMEVLSGVESPKELQHARMETKVNLLSEKLNQANDVTLEAKLEEWLGCGLMSKVDEQHLARVNSTVKA